MADEKEDKLKKLGKVWGKTLDKKQPVKEPVKEENLQELSKDKLRNYIKKSSESIKGYQQGSMPVKKLNDRLKGINKATKKVNVSEMEQYHAVDGKVQHTSGAVKKTSKNLDDKGTKQYVKRLNIKSKSQAEKRSMQESHAQAAIRHIDSGNLKEMQSSFLAALTEKAITKLDDHKINVGKSYFVERSSDTKK